MDRSSLLLIVGALVGAAIIGHATLWRWITRQSRAEEARQDRRVAAGGTQPWLSRTLWSLATPIGCLIWLQCGYVALRLLVPALSGGAAGTWAVALRWVYGLTVLALLLWLLARVGAAIERYLVWRSQQTHNTWDDVMLPLAGRTARRVLPLVAVILGAPALGVSPALDEIVSNATSLLLIGVIAFVVHQLVNAVAMLVLREHQVSAADNLEARAIHTQVMVLKRVATTVVVVFAGASMLMVFEPVRQFGASILASAGIAGIVVGLAAQRSLGSLLAGFQIALTQPIRVDDVVVVENEWGRVEDITLTYVVVKIWDERRLVLPISYFIEHPFQNWTRSSSALLATVFLYVDYQVPLDDTREELTRILRSSKNWDGRVNLLQVTDAREHVVELRVLASATDSGRAWDLRCEIREKLLLFLQRRHPGSLPRLRFEVSEHA